MSTVNPSLTRRVRRANRGFSIVEMMVAIAAGLVLVGSVLALVVAVLQSNAENLAATRLTQELRALALVMGKEVRRVGFIGSYRDTIPSVRFLDPTADPPNGLGTPLLTLSAGGDCIQVGYQVVADDGTTSNRTATIARVVAGGIGSVQVGFSNDPAAPVACDAVDRPIGSSLVDVIDLRFVPDDPADPQSIRIVLTGRLTEGPVSVRNQISRSYVERVFLPALIAG